MLTLTRKTEYAMIAVCHLAHTGSRVVSAREIADEHNVPLPLLMNVLKRLNRTGQVTSVRGARGGYVLNQRPESITLAGLIEAVEGPVHLVRCVNTGKDGRRCERSGQCFIRRSVVKVHERLRKFLMGVTMADLAFDEHNPPMDPARTMVK